VVPGDIISIKPVDIIQVDPRLLEGDPLKIDQVCELFLPSSFSFKIISLLLYLQYIPNIHPIIHVIHILIHIQRHLTLRFSKICALN